MERVKFVYSFQFHNNLTFYEQVKSIASVNLNSII